MMAKELRENLRWEIALTNSRIPSRCFKSTTDGPALEDVGNCRIDHTPRPFLLIRGELLGLKIICKRRAWATTYRWSSRQKTRAPTAGKEPTRQTAKSAHEWWARGRTIARPQPKSSSKCESGREKGSRTPPETLPAPPLRPQLRRPIGFLKVWTKKLESFPHGFPESPNFTTFLLSHKH